MDQNNNYQPPMQPPMQPMQPQESQGMAIAALIMGIAGLIGGWFPIIQYFTLVLSILAIIFGAKARKKSVGAGMATAGMVLGIISVAITVAMIVCVICAAGAIAAAGGAGAFDDLTNQINSALAAQGGMMI